MEDRIRELEESIRTLNERINNNYIENFDNVSTEELERISRDINSAEVDSRVFGEIVTLEILDNNDGGVDFSSIARVASMVDEFTEGTREKLVNIDKEIRKRNDQIETVRRERLEIARRLLSLDGEIRLIKDFTEEDEATLNRMQSNDDQFKKFILDDIKELETKRANYERKVGLVEERKKLKEEYDNLTNRIGMISSGKLDLDKSNDYEVEDLPEEILNHVEEENHENTSLDTVEHESEDDKEEDNQEEHPVEPVPVIPNLDDSNNELSDVTSEDLSDSLEEEPKEDNNENLILPSLLNEENEEEKSDDLLLPPQLGNEADEVVSVTQPTSGLWPKVKKALAGAAVFLLTLAVGGVVAKRMEQNNNEVDEDLSQNDDLNSMDLPTPSPAPSDTLEPTPDNTQEQNSNVTSGPGNSQEQNPSVTPTPDNKPDQTPSTTPTPDNKPSQTPSATPTPDNTPEQTPSVTPTPEPKVELNKNGGENVYDSTTGVEVAADGSAYQHNPDGTTEKLPDVELDETDHNTVVVDSNDLQNNQTPTPTIPPVGDEETFKDALGNGSLTDGEMDNLLDAIEDYDWSSEFNDVPTR